MVGSNPAYATFELRHLFATSKAKFVVVEPELVQGILPAVGEVGILRSNIFIFDTYGQGIPDGYVSWSRLLEYGEEDWLAFDDKAKSQSTIAALNSTSGTTGLPKMAAISHYSYVAQNIQLYDSGEKSYEVNIFLQFQTTTDIDRSLVCYVFLASMPSQDQWSTSLH